MALPKPENLAYRGITSGKAQCMAWRGFFCGLDIIPNYNSVIKFKVYLSSLLKNKVEL